MARRLKVAIVEVCNIDQTPSESNRYCRTQRSRESPATRRRDSAHPEGKKEKAMKSSTKDQVKGKLHEVKGTAKEAVGVVTNNPDLKNEGQAETLAGKVQTKVGQVKKVFDK